MFALFGYMINCPAAKHNSHERWRHSLELFFNDPLLFQLSRGNCVSGQSTRASFTSSIMTDISVCSGSVAKLELISEHCACILDYC